MELFAQFFDIVLHLDQHLAAFLDVYGMWVYVLLFAIIFAETGFVVAPFLPGDSLLFVAGTLAAGHGLDWQWLLPLLVAASFSGDNTNYWIGYHLGPRILRRDESWLLNRKYLDRTHAFYMRHGGKTVLLARFMPILRTFAPFVAGIGRMPYAKFLLFSFSGSVLWVSLFVFAGFYFGHLAIIQEHLTLWTIAVVVLSLLPSLFVWLRHRFRKT